MFVRIATDEIIKSGRNASNVGSPPNTYRSSESGGHKSSGARSPKSVPSGDNFPGDGKIIPGDGDRLGTITENNEGVESVAQVRRTYTYEYFWRRSLAKQQNAMAR